MPWDGIIGMGLATPDIKARDSKPFIESLFDHKLLYPQFKAQFSYFLTKHG